MNTVFVTGGTGFLGSYLIKKLVKNGDRVIALRRENSSLDLLGESIASKVEWIVGDLSQQDILESACSISNQVYHCAAMVSFNSADREKMHSVNVIGTANLVNTALDFPSLKLVHVSSIAAIGRTKENPMISESSEWTRSKLNSQYAISKHLSELEVWRGIAEGLDAVIVNPSIILGAGIWNVGAGNLFNEVYKGLPFYPLGVSGFVDVRDVVECMFLLMNGDFHSSRYILNSEDIAYRQFFDWIASDLKRSKPKIPITPLLGAIAWRVEWLKARILGGKAVATKETVRNSSNSFYYSNEKICEALGFEFRPVRETVQETCEVMLQSKSSGSSFGLFH